jgi:hypothetical protein
MGTPAHFVVTTSRYVTSVCTGVFVALILCNFLYTLHSEHSNARQRLLDDKWLLQRCGEPDFYIRLKQHTDLCEGVEANARRSILLHSFAEALRNTQLCGFDSCTNIASTFVDTIFRGGIITVAIAVAILFTVPIVLTLVYRRLIDSVSEHHLRTKYNMPYGLNTSLLHSQQEHASQYAFNNPTYQTRLIGGSGASQGHTYHSLPDHLSY